MGLQIGLGYLAERPSVARFLAGNQRIARRLGRSGTDEQRFVIAVQRGTNSGRVMARAAEGESARSVFRQVTQGNRFGDVFPSASDTARNRYLDISTSGFLGSHTELVALFKDSPDLLLALEQDTQDGGLNVAHAIASSARLRLGAGSPITVEHLEERPQQAMFVALNIGDAADLLRDNEDLARAFTKGPGNAWEDVVRSRVAEQAAGLFDPGSPLDQEFLRSHPRTAIYLMEHPGRVRSLNRNSSAAREFVHTAGAIEARLEQYVTERATSLLSNRVTFSESRIETTPGFAELLVGDYLTREDGSLVAYINNTVSETPMQMSFGRVLAEQHARAAAERVSGGNLFDVDFFKDNPGIASLAIASDRFVEGLSRDRQMVERFIHLPFTESVPRYIERKEAMAAFSVGYVRRLGGSLDLRA